MSHDTAKSIILFSDGTGNSSAKLFKTNVWRMYEAVDLGPSAEGKRDQISYYDDGVGTSSFKPLTLLGRRVRLGAAAKRAGYLPLRLPQLPGRRRHLRLRVQPRRVHRAPGRRAHRVGRAGPFQQRSRARSKEPRRVPRVPRGPLCPAGCSGRPSCSVAPAPSLAPGSVVSEGATPTIRQTTAGRRSASSASGTRSPRTADRSPKSRGRSTTGSTRSACRTTS